MARGVVLRKSRKTAATFPTKTAARNFTPLRKLTERFSFTTETNLLHYSHMKNTLTEKEAARLANLSAWGEKMKFARELLDAAKLAAEQREELFFNHRKNVK